MAMQKKTMILFAMLAIASSGAVIAADERSGSGRIADSERVVRNHSICLSTGPVENIALGGVEDGPYVDLVLAARFVTLNILNNSAQEVQFDAKVFQIDGPGDFEGGSWPATGKAKIERFSGTRTPVAAQGSAILTADLGDDPEPSYAYEGQIKVTGLSNRRLKREEVLATAHSRRDEDLRINPEHRIINTEWTEIPCTW